MPLFKWTKTLWWIGLVDGALPITDLILLGILAAETAIGVLVYEEVKPRVIVTTKTKEVEDVAPKIPSGGVYKLAFVDKTTDTLKILEVCTLSYSEAIIVEKLANPIVSQIKRRYSSLWGLYAEDQADAKAVAVALGFYECPKVHDSGYYAQYHDGNHNIHIWFGNPMIY